MSGLEVDAEKRRRGELTGPSVAEKAVLIGRRFRRIFFFFWALGLAAFGLESVEAISFGYEAFLIVFPLGFAAAIVYVFCCLLSMFRED
jgi:hypothetical protein